MVRKAILRMIGKIHIYLFRKRGRMKKLRGMPVLLLTTIGSKSGQKRTAPLLTVIHEGKYLVTGSNYGGDRHPSWYFNIRKNPLVEVEINDHQFQTDAIIATPEDAENLYSLFIQKADFYATYKQKTARKIPIIILDPANALSL